MQIARTKNAISVRFFCEAECPFCESNVRVLCESICATVLHANCSHKKRNFCAFFLRGGVSFLRIKCANFVRVNLCICFARLNVSFCVMFVRVICWDVCVIILRVIFASILLSNILKFASKLCELFASGFLQQFSRLNLQAMCKAVVLIFC